MRRRLRIAPLALAIVAAIASPIATPIAVAAGPDSKQEAASTVDINTATVEELMTVQGIGQVIAQRIVEFRESNGPYKSVDDLLKVQGIGEKSLNRIRERLIVGKGKK